MGRQPVMKAAELYACLYAHEFPAQAVLRLRPDMQGNACVVMAGEPPSQTVCSLNTKARLLGMSRGMTRVEVDTFAGVTALSRCRQAERTTRAILLECAGAFSPRVEERSGEAEFCCVIDIAGTQGLFGPPRTLAQTLLQRVRAVGVSGRVTVSGNFETAVSLAQGMQSGTQVKVVPVADEAEALSSLAVFVLDLSESQAETFALWGIQTLGDLAALPEAELISRIGQDAKRLLQLARGERPHLFQPVEPPFQLAEWMELDSPVELLESLFFVVAVMLDQLILRASARVLAIASVTISLTLEGGGTHVRTVRPALPSADKQLWIKLLHLDLEAHPPPAAVLAIAIDAEPGSTSKVQLGLFSPQLPESSRLDVTLARIRAIVGDDCVGRPVLEDTHASDRFRIAPFTVPQRESRTSHSALSPQSRAAMRQLRPPEKTAVTLQNARPVAFFYGERRYTVANAYGPWLIGGEWWSPTLWASEQWDIVAHDQDGAMLCCCIVRDIMRGQWHMAGLYD